jgi:hypothetical protein
MEHRCQFIIDASLFKSVVMVAFQNIFHIEMHQKDIFFYFLKIIFEISTSKQSKILKKINFL